MMPVKPREMASAGQAVIKGVMMKTFEVFAVVVMKVVDGIKVRDFHLFRAIAEPGSWFRMVAARWFDLTRIEVVFALFRRVTGVLHPEARLVG